MFKKQMTIIVPRCPVCGRLMYFEEDRARIAVTFPSIKAKRVQDAKQGPTYASFEICAEHLRLEGSKAMLTTYLIEQHAILGTDAPGLQAEMT